MDAERLDQITAAYRESQLVFTALRLGLFELLAEGPATAAEIAGRLQTDLRAMRIVADALVALELLEKQSEAYSLTPVSAEVLVSGAPGSKAARYLLGARQYDRWGRLIDIVRCGRRQAPAGSDPDAPMDTTPVDTEPPHTFAAAMADVGRVSAAVLLDRVDLSGVGRLLDLAGGPGVYAIAIAEAHPGVEAVVFDRPDTIEVAQRNIDAAGLEGRVRILAGDAFADELGGPYDLILVSNFLHIFAAGDIRCLLGRCAAALAPDGRLCIKEFVLDDSRTSPTGVALFAVNMLVSTDRGDCFTQAEICAWLHEAGLELESRVDLTPQSAVLLARHREVGSTPGGPQGGER